MKRELRPGSQHKGEGCWKEEGGEKKERPLVMKQVGWLKRAHHPLQGPRLGPGERQHELKSRYLLENEGFHSSG